VLLPLVMMPIYLVGPLVFGKTGSTLFEIVFANLALLATILCTLVVEAQLESRPQNTSFKVVSILLFTVSLVQFIVFTYQLPWFDIFTVPPGY
jgi:hypothetical protein